MYLNIGKDSYPLNRFLVSLLFRAGSIEVAKTTHQWNIDHWPWIYARGAVYQNP